MSDTPSFIKFSVTDILKKGIGSSSSHTLAPWRSAQACYSTLQTGNWLADLTGVTITLYGSLAFVGRGHYTTVALPLGFLGYDVMTFDVSTQLQAALGIASVTDIGQLTQLTYPDSGQTIRYTLIFDTVNDTNQEKMLFTFHYGDSGSVAGRPDSLTYYSYGGGSYGTAPQPQPLYANLSSLPVEYQDAASLMAQLDAARLMVQLGNETLSDAIMRNEDAFAAYRLQYPDPSQPELPTSRAQVIAYLKDIAVQMGQLIFDGVTYADDDNCYQIMYATPRAKTMYQQLIGAQGDISSLAAFFIRLRQLNPTFSFDQQLELVSLFALAVSEQNSALKHVVTAPTNGSCGTVPAVLYYYVVQHASDEEVAWLFDPDATGDSLNGILRFLVTASTVGGIVKNNANISGGVGGCQAEVGTSAAMAAGGLSDVLSGQSPVVAFNAAEAALEDQLGSTCDPIGGLVELPCIDRNLSAAMMAITVSQTMLNLGSDYQSTVPFDKAVEAMENISDNMSDLYKETSTGGLALVMQSDVEAKRPDLFPPTPALRSARNKMRIPIFRTTC